MKILKIVGITFSVIGIVLLVLTFFIYQSTARFVDDAQLADGTVIDLVRKEDMYTPVVIFESREGVTHQFVSSLSSNPAGFAVGEQVEVLYLPNNPTQASIKSFMSLWFGALIVGFLGSVFAIVGLSIVGVGYLNQRNKKHLLLHGRRIQTKFQSVEINTSFSSNGKNPYQIHSQWLDPSSGDLHIFKSENIWFDPTDHIGNDEIEVLIDKNNPRKYYVDLSFLPKLA